MLKGTLALTMLCGLLGTVAPQTAAAQSGWTASVGDERSAVTINGVPSNWWTQRAQVAWVQPRTGGWFAGVDRQTRFGSSDVTFSTSAYKRLGPWTVAGGAAGTPDPTFWFRTSVDGELSREVAGTVVASVGFRQMDFPTTTVRQVQPALAWYHAKGELQGRLFVTRSSVRDSSSLTMLVQGSYQATPRLRWLGAVARGDRIFDISSLPTGTARAWTVAGSARFALTTHVAVEVGGGFAHEEPAFDQRTLTLSLRGSF